MGSKEGAGAAGERAEATMGSAKGAFEEAHGAIEDGIDQVHAYLKREWRERPLAVTMTALGAGIVIGLLLSSRR